MNNKKPFEAKTKLRCAKCDDVVFSKYSGDWSKCKCGAIYVDETDHYCRMGGNAEDIIRIYENGEEKSLAQEMKEAEESE